jgi:hypothetical protein
MPEEEEAEPGAGDGSHDPGPELYKGEPLEEKPSAREKIFLMT